MGGSTPSTTTQNVTQKTELPAWYESYLQDVMGRATTQANSAQPPPPTQQIAGLTPDQLEAYQSVHNIQTLAQPDFNNAGEGYRAASGIDFTDASYRGYGDIRQGVSTLQQAGDRNTADAAQPYAQQGLGYLQQSAQGSALSSANPYIQASTQPTGLQAASPYLGAASQNSYEGIGNYMNPYNQAVTDQIAQLGARNLSENLLPALSDDFVRAGQYGSTRQRDLVGRAVRDTQNSVLAQQGNVLQQGYGQALGAEQADLARQAGLAGTAGGLGTAQQQALLGAGQASGQLSSSDLARLQAAGVDVGQLGLGLSAAQATDAARQLAAGQAIGNLGLGQGQLGLAAAQAQASAKLSGSQGLQSLGTQRVNSGLQTASALEGAGAAQQGVNQANLNSLYNNQLSQYNLPWDTIAKLSGVIQGLPVGGSTSGTTQTTSPGPSVAGQTGGIALGVAGLANSGIFRAKGGAVKKPRANHSYGKMPRRGISIASAA